MKTITSAEEKHYQKLNKKLNQRLNEYIEKNSDLNSRNLQFKHLNEVQFKMIEELRLENTKLKSLLNLSNEEVKELVNSSKSINNLSSIYSLFGTNYR